MKRTIAFLLLFTLIFGLSACASSAETVKLEEKSGSACVTLTGEFDGDKDTKDDTVLIVAGKDSVSMVLTKGNVCVQDDAYEVIMRVGGKKYETVAFQDDELSYSISFDKSFSITLIDALKSGKKVSLKFTSPKSDLKYAFKFDVSNFDRFYKW